MKTIKVNKELIVSDLKKFAIVFFTLLLLIDISPVGGNLKLYFNWAKCRGRPYADDYIYEGQVPHYILAPGLLFLQGNNRYYCTEKDAQSAGLSADVDDYSFPLLPNSEFQNLIKKSQSYYK